LCGTPSAPMQATPVATRATLPNCVSGQPFTPSEPANVGSVGAASYAVQFRGEAGAWPPVNSWQAWTPELAVPEGSTAVRIKATVGGYTDPEFGETTCEVPPPPEAPPAQDDTGTTNE